MGRRVHRWSIILIFAIYFIFGGESYCQSLHSNFGKEFYLAFGKNDGDDESANVLGLYLTSPYAATGIVEVPRLGFKSPFKCTPGTITPIFLPSDTSIGSAEITQSDSVFAGAAIHITADTDVAVFGLSHKSASSDAFMGLPVVALGTEYRTLNAPTSLRDSTQKTGGEITIVGTASNTKVSITPTARLVSGQLPGSSFQIVLGAGDVYMIVGDRTDSMNDLTGTHISSDKPISIFSGHERAGVGYNIIGGVTRNHLVEQLPPIPSWGNSAIIVPYDSSAKPDLVRILSSEDGNTITMNGNVVAVLNAGQFYEIAQLTRPAVVQSSNPILVGQYMHSSWLANQTVGAIGDPCLALIYPTEQFASAYTVTSIEETAFAYNFVNIVIDSLGSSTMKMDNVALLPSIFTLIPNSRFAFARIRLKQGTHEIVGSTPFGITMYALGKVDAYSYPGGSLLKSLVPASSRFVGFDSTLLCQPEERTVCIANPNSVPAILTTASILEANPSIFSIQVSLPITIPPNDSIAIPVTFAPDSAGSFSAILNLSFSSPRHQSITVPLSAVGSTLPASLWAPRNTRLLAGESFEMPVWAASDLSPYRIQAFRIALSYDPRYLQWYDVDQNNTLSYYSYFQPSGFPGSDTLAFQFVQDSSINGGGVSDPRPLAYLKFHTSADGENMATFYQSLDIHYNVIVDRGAIGDLCLAKIEPPGHIVLDSTCGTSALLTDSTIAMLSSIEPNYPNPASATTLIPFTVGSLCRRSPSSTTEAPVSLKLYNALGSLVAQPIDGTLSEGLHVCQLDCTNFPKGMYVIELNVAGKHYRRKMIVTR